MKKTLVLFSVLLLTVSVSAQKYLTRNGTIKFHSETPLEEIEAINNQVSGVINMDNGEMALTLLMKAFEFEKALMQEHFNEKYVESDEYPKAKFVGSVEDFSSLTLTDKPQVVTIKGKLTIHGVTQDVVVKGSLAKNGDKIVGTSTFQIKPEDYDIKIPRSVKDNIAKTIDITVKMEYAKR